MEGYDDYKVLEVLEAFCRVQVAGPRMVEEDHRPLQYSEQEPRGQREIQGEWGILVALWVTLGRSLLVLRRRGCEDQAMVGVVEEGLVI